MRFGQLKRREFITLVGGAAAWPVTARAQQGDRIRRVGIVMPYPKGDTEYEIRAQALRQELARLGWTEGGNVQFDERWTTDNMDLVRANAASLVASNPDVVVATGGRVIPLLMQLSHTYPGGTITGFMHYEPAMGGKWLETLKEVSPGISRALVLLLPDVAANVEFLRAAQAAGPVHNVAVEGAGVRNTDDVMRTMTSFGDGPAAGVVALPNPVTGGNRKLIADLAIKQRLSTIAAFRYVAASGALVSYGIDVLALFQSAAGYIDRILKGENPANLPVQAPTKYELVINLKTANALGLQVPPTMLARADEVIE